MAAAAMGKIERAHRMYREGCHEVALGLYTDALAMAKTKAQKIALHSNRAACYLKLHDFKKAAEECTSVLELDHQHTGALMLRAQTLVTLKDYQSALFDVNRLMELNPLSDVYRNLQARLKTQLSLAPIPESEEEASSLEENEEEVQPKGTRTQSEEERKVDPADEKPEAPVTQPANTEEASANTSSKPQGWEAIPKPKGHSGLDYSRWDRVEDDSSEEEEDDTEDQQPRSFNRPSGHILIKVVLRHKQHAGHLVLTPIDSLSWGVL
nr:PREDICTED: protein unc-45 homolog A isoform X1 [Musa acuminata subsp. malaccensis]